MEDKPNQSSERKLKQLRRFLLDYNAQFAKRRELFSLEDVKQ
jgi:hypothetical protein